MLNAYITKVADVTAKDGRIVHIAFIENPCPRETNEPAMEYRRTEEAGLYRFYVRDDDSDKTITGSFIVAAAPSGEIVRAIASDNAQAKKYWETSVDLLNSGDSGIELVGVRHSPSSRAHSEKPEAHA